jgi:hypothetical protein
MDRRDRRRAAARRGTAARFRYCGVDAGFVQRRFALNRIDRIESKHAVSPSHFFAFGLLFVAYATGGATTQESPSGLAQEAELHGDIQVDVVLDAAEQNGKASATVRIHAPREVVWSLITSCQEAMTLVPGLMGCVVLDTAPDGSQTIRHVLDYSWYVPKVTYVFRASYDKPSRVSIERISGDLHTLQVSWTLTADGEDTVAKYAIDLAPGFWVPHWVIRMALRRDLPKMLRALRARAEASPR